MTTVHAEYHLFQISDQQGQGIAEDLDTSETGLVQVNDGSVEVLTGVHSGDVNLCLETHDRAPAPALGPWDEVVEISVRSTSGNLFVHALMGHTVDALSLAANGPGAYRLRIHAKGRDTAVEMTTEGPVEDYLIQSWPAPLAPYETLKITDEYGATWRSTPTSLPPEPKLMDEQEAMERDILRQSGGFS